MTAPFRCFVQDAPGGEAEWTAGAARVEALGFDGLAVADHPGLTASPFVALAAAAPATRSLALGTAVVNTGVREPLDVAADAATLDLVSGGRAFLGVGAGHTPAEWAAVGRSYPSVGERVARCAEVVPLLARLLEGDTVTHSGAHFHLHEARLPFSPPRRVPLVVGANHPTLVRVGAAWADAVELSGLGRTLADGHFHELRWSPARVDAVVDGFHRARRARSAELGALVQAVIESDDAEAAAAQFLALVARQHPEAGLPTVAELIAVPYLLVGTIAEITDQLRAARDRWGFSRFTVRASAIDTMAKVMELVRA